MLAMRTQTLAMVHGFDFSIEESRKQKAYSILLSKNATLQEKKACEALTLFANGLEILEFGKKASCWKKYRSIFSSSKK